MILNRIRLWFYVALGLVFGAATYWTQYNRRRRRREEQRRKQAEDVLQESEAARELEHDIQRAMAEVREHADKIEKEEAQRRADGRRPDSWGDRRL